MTFSVFLVSTLQHAKYFVRYSFSLINFNSLRSCLFPAEACQRRNSFSNTSNAYLLHKTAERSVSFGERISNFLSNDCVVILGLAKCNRYLEVLAFFSRSFVHSQKCRAVSDTCAWFRQRQIRVSGHGRGFKSKILIYRRWTRGDGLLQFGIFVSTGVVPRLKKQREKRESVLCNNLSEGKSFICFIVLLIIF